MCKNEIKRITLLLVREHISNKTGCTWAYEITRQRWRMLRSGCMWFLSKLWAKLSLKQLASVLKKDEQSYLHSSWTIVFIKAGIRGISGGFTHYLWISLQFSTNRLTSCPRHVFSLPDPVRLSSWVHALMLPPRFSLFHWSASVSSLPLQSLIWINCFAWFVYCFFNHFHHWNTTFVFEVWAADSIY